MNQNYNQNHNQKNEGREPAQRRHTFYLLNLIFLSSLTIISLLFALFVFFGQRIRTTGRFGRIYTQSQISEVREEAAQEEKDRLLQEIRSQLESGMGTTQMLRGLFEDEIVVVRGGKYHFFPLAKEVEKNPLLPGTLTCTGGVAEYTGEDPEVELLSGVLLSDYNGRIDWDRLTDSGIGEVTVAAGTVSERGFSEDVQFERNCRKAEEKGFSGMLCIEITGPGTNEALQAAADVIREAAEEHGTSLPRGTPVLLRIDSRDYMPDDEKSIRAMTRTVKSLCALLEKEEMEPVIGADLYTFAARIDLSSLSTYRRWLIDHEPAAAFPYSFNFWEHTAEGGMEGVPGSAVLYSRLKIYDFVDIH